MRGLAAPLSMREITQPTALSGAKASITGRAMAAGFILTFDLCQVLSPRAKTWPCTSANVFYKTSALCSD